jgi:4-hydroxybenzoate polyprenyltransferase
MPSAAFRILRDVAVYRVRRLEMANLGATIALMLALRTGVKDLCVRGAFAAVLNLFAYLNNDYQDVEHDLREGRDSEKTRFLAEHLRAAFGVQIALSAVLVLAALLYDPGLLVAIALGAGLCVVYSGRLKGVPFVDVLAMAAWGVGMTAVAFPVGARLGWALAVQLGLFSAVFETIQVVRDHDGDKAEGVRTTAVFLGPERTLLLARALVIVSAAYGTAFLHRWFGPAELVALAVPTSVSASRIDRYWTAIRVVFGVVLIGIFGWVFATGRAFGAIF